MNFQLIKECEDQYSLPIVQVLNNRGIEDVYSYLNTTDDAILDPKLLSNVDNGIKMLFKHIALGEKILVCVDEDCDGQTSSAVLLNYLHRLVPKVVEEQFYYVFHEDKQHGISSILDKIKPNTSLIVAPDSSSNEYEIHKKLKSDGIDVLVLDHHQAEKVSENACVINNQLCDYPTKSLSGVGVVYKFCQRIDKILNIDFANDFLDLVATGIIADVMSLKDLETKRIVEKGLASIQNPFLKEMVKKNSFQLKNDVTPMGIAFYVAPYVNAVTRVGTIDEKQNLFESMLEWKAYDLIPSTKRGCSGKMEQIVEQAVRQCANIKNRQAKFQKEIVERISYNIGEYLSAHKIIAVLLETLDFPVGLKGIVANKIANEYQRPCLILTKTKHENGYWYEGSARGYGLESFKQLCDDTGLVEYAEGHNNAFGFGIKEENIKEFLDTTDEILKDYDCTPSYKVDFIFDSNEITKEFILDIGRYKHIWGQQVEEPLIAITNIRLTKENFTLMSKNKNPTLKFIIRNNIACIKFKSSEEELEKLFPDSDSGCVVLNVVGRCEINTFNDNINPQIIVENYDIVSNEKYYF